MTLGIVSYSMQGVMVPHQCPYCRQLFTPSLYHPDQVVCSDKACQLRRRTEYHRNKVREDPAYRMTVADSRSKWRNTHRDYMRTYRARRRHASPPSAPVPLLASLAQQAKNNLAVDLKHCSAAVWLICNDKNGVRNTVACAELIVIQCVPEPTQGAAT
jgi:hypothetical protein